MAPPSDGLHARAFAADAETERALRSGLAGRDVKVQRARLPAAIRILAAEPAPKLVLVDLDRVPEPEAAIRELAAVCALGTAMIALGSTDNAHLTRTLLRSGVADYLVKPISPADVREASAAALDELPERAYAGRVVAFAGAAGSGTSTLVAAIAQEVAANGRVAVVLDLDPESGSLSALLGTEPAGDLPALLSALDPGPPPDPDEFPDADEAPAPVELEPFAPDSPINPEELDGVCASAGSGVSLVAYPLAGSPPPGAGPDGGTYPRRVSCQPRARGAGHRSLRPRCADRDHAARRCAGAAL